MSRGRLQPLQGVEQGKMWQGTISSAGNRVLAPLLAGMPGARMGLHVPALSDDNPERAAVGGVSPPDPPHNTIGISKYAHGENDQSHEGKVHGPLN